jgi:anti-anti-sigma factor
VNGECELEVTIRRQGAVCVLAIGGELDIATSARAAELAAPAAALPAERFVLDLSRLRFIDGRGVQMLAALTRSVAPGVPVIVRSASSRIQRVLQVLGVDLEDRAMDTGGRGEWLLLESRALRGWARETRVDSRRLRAASQDLVSASEQLLARSRALCDQTDPPA